MAERRNPEQKQARSPLPPEGASSERDAADQPILDLQRQAGNKAVADILAGRAPTPAATPAVRLRDSLRADRAPLQPEFGLHVQRAPVGAKDPYGKEVTGPPYPGRLLKMGSRGPDVAQLQAMVGVNADGIFGPITRAAVVAFQRSAGLAADGIVGPQTWAALTGATAETGKLPSPIDKMPSYTDKLPSAPDKMPSETDKLAGLETDKMPSYTDKMPSETDKLAGLGTDKMASYTDKMPSETDKMPSETDKLAEYKLLEEEGKLW